MGQFYSLLREYNLLLDYSILPEWASIYTKEEPPVYWTRLVEILNLFPKSFSVFEIGSGLGDVLALIRSMGFHDVRGIERREDLATIGNQKLLHFFNSKDIIIGNYPIEVLNIDVLVQVNCVYFDGIENTKDYMNQIYKYHQFANPKHFILEVIDRTFREPSCAFPNFLRISETEINACFDGYSISSSLTYQYPKSSSTKRLYLISK